MADSPGFLRRFFQLTPKLKAFRDRSWLAFAVERVFLAAQLLSPATFLLETRAWSQRTDTPAETSIRGNRVDTYIAVWMLILGVCACLAPSRQGWLNALIATLVSLRIFDVLQTSVNVSIFDHLRVEGEPTVAHVTRSVVLAIWNYVEMAFAFGILYCVLPQALTGASGRLDRYYFSAATQLTLGADSISPIGPARLLVILQGISGVLLLGILLGRFIAVMPTIKEGADSPTTAA